MLPRLTEMEPDMLNSNAIICLMIYSAILVTSYIVVRRGWVRAYPTFLVGFVANALTLFCFSLFRGTGMLHGLVVCLIWAGFFTAASVLMATLFRDAPVSASSRVVVLVQEPSIQAV